MAGLAAGYELGRNGVSTTVFEAGARLGGRVSTVERGPIVFDDGAQFIRTETPVSEQLLLRDLPADALFDIGRDVRPFDYRGHVGPGDPAQNSQPKWGYRGGLRVLPHLLAEASAAEVHLGWPVTRLELSGGRWTVHGTNSAVGEFEAVLLTLPPGAVGALLRRSDETAGAGNAFAQARHRAIISVAFEPGQPAVAPGDAYALMNSDRKHAISWLAFESAKPGHVPAGREVLVAQMAEPWSAPRFGHPDRSIGTEAVSLCGALLGVQLVARWTHVTRWSEALPDSLATDPTLDEANGVFFAGDSLVGGRVHLAIESGLSAAGRIVRRLDAQS